MVTREQAIKAYQKIIDKEFFEDNPCQPQRMKYACMAINHLLENGECSLAENLRIKIRNSAQRKYNSIKQWDADRTNNNDFLGTSGRAPGL